MRMRLQRLIGEVNEVDMFVLLHRDRPWQSHLLLSTEIRQRLLHIRSQNRDIITTKTTS